MNRARVSRGLVGLVTLLILLVCAPRVHAASDAQRARAKFEEGVTLSDGGRWAEALAAFRESDQLVSSASAQYNIGATLRALGRYVEARRTLEQTLATAKSFRPPLRKALKKRVGELLAEVKQKIVVVRVKIRPTHATLQVDGAEPRRLPDGRLELDPGKHVFSVEAEGHQTTTTARALTAGDTEIELKAPKNAIIERVVEIPAEEPSSPFYESVWFWTSAGVVIVGVTVIAIAASSGSDPAAPPGPPPATVDQIIPARWRF